MVPPALCLYLSSLARKRFLLTGDPQQLGPVFETTGRTQNVSDQAMLNAVIWIGQDIFLKSGLIESTNGGASRVRTDDSRLCRITAQRRCAREIWNHVSELYPNVAFQADEARAKRLAELPPHPGKAVVVMDTSSNLRARCEKAGRSWKNEFSASRAIEVALTIAAEADPGTSIAIITPYRGQVRVIQKYIKNELVADPCPLKTNRIRLEAGTVHQFQGSETDVVIFDIVDGEGRTALGALLKGGDGARLVNVAMTRARGKLIILADRTWCERCRIHEANPLLAKTVLNSLPEDRIRVVSHRASRNPDDWGSVPIDPSSPLFQVNQSESPIEERLRSAMLRLPALAKLARQQVRIRNGLGEIITRADFAFPTLKYAVFCDGRMWHAVENRWHADLRIGTDLTELGWSCSRYSGQQINRDATTCAAQIERTLRARFESFRAHLCEPWELPLSQWKEAVEILKAFEDHDGLTKIGGHGHSHAHKVQVMNAQQRGIRIAAEVLRDYPDLAATTSR